MLAAATVTYQREALSESLWDELMPLLARHYAEVSPDPDIALDPDILGYQRVEDAGMLRVYTARERTKLIGYLAVFVSPSLHSRGKFNASSDAIYVLPDERGLGVGRGLIECAKKHLADQGVQILHMHTKHPDDLNAGAMLRRLGFDQVDEVWAVRLDRR